MPAEFARAAGLRNRLAHAYDTIDDEALYHAIPTALDNCGCTARTCWHMWTPSSRPQRMRCQATSPPEAGRR